MRLNVEGRKCFAKTRQARGSFLYVLHQFQFPEAVADALDIFAVGKFIDGLIPPFKFFGAEVIKKNAPVLESVFQNSFQFLKGKGASSLPYTKVEFLPWYFR